MSPLFLCKSYMYCQHLNTKMDENNEKNLILDKIIF